MTLHLAAKHLASKGRGPDSALVHMAPNEVAGLQALAKAHGGSLSVNPDTGLPEAGFLSSILPAVAGFALGPAGFGLMSPLMAGATVGGISALTSGNLSKGLMAGMGAYGGAGIGEGLASMGQQAMAANAIPQTTVDEFGQIVQNPAFQQAPPASGFDKAVAGAKAAWNDPSKLASGLGGGDSKKGWGYMAAAAAPTVMEAVAPKQTPAAGMKTDNVMPQRLEYNPRTGRYDPISSSQAYQMRYYADGGATPWDTRWKPDVRDYGQQNQNFGRELLYYDMGNSADNQNPIKKAAESGVDAAAAPLFPQDFGGSEYGPGRQINPTYNASGYYTGIPMALWGKSPADAAATPVEDRVPVPVEAIQAAAANPSTFGLGFDAAGMNVDGGAPGANADGYGGGDAGFGGGSQPFASGGIAALAEGGSSLGSYSDGGQLLRGPGDGVSDSIPATISGNQPARLADGEFVIPARIVSELGNGSTEAGSRKLYAMMDRIQKNRQKSIGKGKVAVNSKSEKLLPA